MNSSRRAASRVLRGQAGRHATAATFTASLPERSPSPATDSSDPIAQARAAGYEEGYRAARAEAEAGSQAGRDEQLRRLADALVSAAAEAGTARAATLTVATREAVELAFELAEALVQRELQLASDVGVQAVTRAVGLLPNGEDLVVRLHPDDVVTAEELGSVVADASVKVVADPDVEPGGCVVEAGPCHVDAQIGAALRRARQLVDCAGRPGGTP